ERRGVREETAAAFALGVAPAGNLLARKSSEVRGMLPLLRELGLVRNDGRDFFSNRLIFPIADESGHWIGFGARRLNEEDQPKFINSKETLGVFEKKRVLYALNKARDAKPRAERLVVVEGYLDVVIAHQAGCTNVVAALGVGFTREHASLARRFVEGRVTLLFDGDAAGRTANGRVLEELLDTDLDLRVASLPEKMDPDDFLLKEGKEAFDRLVSEGARDSFEYLVDATIKKCAGGAGGPDASPAAVRITPAAVAECARLMGKFQDDIKLQL